MYELHSDRTATRIYQGSRLSARARFAGLSLNIAYISEEAAEQGIFDVYLIDKTLQPVKVHKLQDPTLFENCAITKYGAELPEDVGRKVIPDYDEYK